MKKYKFTKGIVVPDKYVTSKTIARLKKSKKIATSVFYPHKVDVD